jgi:L-amino acid N-acyltransferase YncA
MSPEIPPKNEIRSVALNDAEQICQIYNYYVMTTTITFEETPVSTSEMTNRIRDVQSIPLPWLVAANGQEILGYAYAQKWKARAAYKFSVEVTIYVRPGLGHAGVGSQLYSRLFEALRSSGAHAVIGGVALPNDASLRLHQKFGFEKVAHFKEVGFKHGHWVDVTYWQIILNP